MVFILSLIPEKLSRSSIQLNETILHGRFPSYAQHSVSKRSKKIELKMTALHVFTVFWKKYKGDENGENMMANFQFISWDYLIY